MSDIDQARDARRHMMLEESVYKIIPLIALPMVVSMLVDSFYNLADTFFVSQLGTAATAAVGINNSLMHFIRAVGMGFGLGASSYISRLLGTKDHENASRVAATALYSAAAVICVFASIAFFFQEEVVVFLGATPSAKPYSMEYASFILLAAPFTALNTVLSQTLRAEGSTTYSMLGMVSGCLVNLVLDPLFIFVFHWGVAGAAAATAISKICSFFVLLIPYLRGKSLLNISFKYFSPSVKLYMEISRIGIPSFLRTCLMSFSAVITNNYAGNYGDSVLAAVSVSNRIVMMISSIVLGFGQGFQPIAGYCWGAKKYRRVHHTFWVTSLYGAGICAVLGLSLYFGAPYVVSLFSKDDSEIIRIGAYMVRIQCLTLPFHMWVMIINSLYQSIGRAIGSAVLGLSRQALCLIPCMIIMNTLFQVNGLMNAQAVADVMSMFIAIPMLIHVLRQINHLAETHPAEAL